MPPFIVTAYLSNVARHCCYAALFLGYLTSPISAQESTTTSSSPTADVPIYRIGDKWTFEYSRVESEQRTSVVQTVVAVTEKQTTFSSERNGRPPHEVVFDNQANLTRVGSTTYEPSLGSLSFPMMVGKSWDSHNIQRFTSGSIDVSIHVEVVAFERVQVAAGSFDAYKIVSRGVNAVQHERLFSAPFRATYWYAPSVKRVVKSEFALYLPGRMQTENFELTDFSLAP
jgi:hypothetical protein